MILTTISIFIQTWIQVMFSLWKNCKYEQKWICQSYDDALHKEFNCFDLTSPRYEEGKLEWADSSSFCNYLSDWYHSYSSAGGSLKEAIVIYLLPIWAFFLLNVPHDCFKCLGKDPDRIFSQS